MKLVPKASMAFKLDSAGSKTGFGSNVVNCLTPVLAAKKSKLSASDLPVPVAGLQAINDSLVIAVANNINGGRAASAALKAAIVAWNEAFSQTAKFISNEADGDPALILACGFIPTKSESAPVPKPGPVANFGATINGSKGAIIAGTKKGVPNSKAYVVAALPPGASANFVQDTMIITMGDSSIYLSVNTRGETELYNLPSGIAYNVTMFAVNSAGSGPAAPGKQVIPQ